MSLQENCCIRDCLHKKGVELTQAEAHRVINLAITVIEQRWPAKGEAVTSPEIAKNYFRLKLSNLKHEVFSGLFLDSKHRIIAYEQLFTGTIDSATIHPRVVAQRALEHNAAALIVAHNHPSGVSEPSLADKLITQSLNLALEVLGIKLLDHLIIGQGEPSSLMEMGEL